MADAVEKALELFKGGYNCCQSVLAAVSEDFGLDAETAVRLATGFGVGFSRGGTCGAVSGAVMLLGLAGGGGGPENVGRKTATYARTREFYSRFIERNGSLVCRDLLGLDPSTPDGLAAAREKNCFSTTCRFLVTDAVRLAQDIIKESGLPDRP